jgi:hypothetical protein
MLHNNNTSNSGGLQAPAGYSKVRVFGGEQEEIGSAARYLTQLYIMLRTARRQSNARVVCALRGLIARRKGNA